MQTRIFKSGNSLAVRIPRELAFADDVQEVEIERVGDALMLRPVQQATLADLGNVLAQFSPGYMAGGREEAPEQDRPWGGKG